LGQPAFRETNRLDRRFVFFRFPPVGIVEQRIQLGEVVQIQRPSDGIGMLAIPCVAADVASRQQGPATYNPSRWGEVLAFLRSSGEITVEEEKGLAGVFGFLSPGAHRPVGIPEDQMTRLGRSFALNMCWFLLKNHLTRIQQP